MTTLDDDLFIIRYDDNANNVTDNSVVRIVRKGDVEMGSRIG